MIGYRSMQAGMRIGLCVAKL